MQQRTPEWYAARCGKVGASQVAAALSKTKSGWGASRANLMAEKVVERMTGIMTESYVSQAMQHGIDTEADARAAYSFYASCDVVEAGWLDHPGVAMSGCSPDGLIGDNGLVEIKCPNSATHIETLLSGKIPSNYITQMQWQMATTNRGWCDFVSFDPRMPEELRLFVSRVERDNSQIVFLEGSILEFLREVDEKVSALRALSGRRIAA